MGYWRQVSKFVLALLIIQLLGGAYLFTFTTNAGRPESNARATRLSSPILAFHALAAGSAVVSWLGWMGTGEVAAAWATFVILLLAAGGGTLMTLKTVAKPSVLEPDERPGGERPSVTDPADVLVAEKQMPLAVILMHGVIAAALIGSVLYVALTA